MYKKPNSQLSQAEQIEHAFAKISEVQEEKVSTKLILTIAQSGLFHSYEPAREIIRGFDQRPERFNDIAVAAANLVACQRNASACRPNQLLHVEQCLKAHNCAVNLPLDQFIAQRMLTPSEFQMARRFAERLNADLNRYKKS